MNDARVPAYPRIDWSHLEQIPRTRFDTMDWLRSAVTADVMATLAAALSKLVGHDIQICSMVFNTGGARHACDIKTDDRLSGAKSSGKKSRLKEKFDPDKTRIGVLQYGAIDNDDGSFASDDSAGVGPQTVELLGVPTWAVVCLASDVSDHQITCRIPVAIGAKWVAGYLGASALTGADISMLPFDCGVFDYIVALLLRGSSLRLARSTVVASSTRDKNLARCRCRDDKQQFDIFVDVDELNQMAGGSAETQVYHQPTDQSEIAKRWQMRMNTMTFDAAVILGRVDILMDDVLAIELGDCIVTSLRASGTLSTGQIEIPALDLSASGLWAVDKQHRSALPKTIQLKGAFMSNTENTTISKIPSAKVTSNGLTDDRPDDGLIKDATAIATGAQSTDVPTREALRGVELEVAIELGRFSLPLSAVVESGAGDVIHLDKALSAGVKLRAGDAYLADGELVDIDGNIGIRINRVY